MKACLSTITVQSFFVLLVLGCTTTSPRAPAATPTGTIRISFAQPDAGCPLAAIPRAVTFSVDPT
jgi:hypothetical protein